MKPYKDDTPENTIQKIKNILFGLEIETEEYNSTHNGLFTTTVKISNDDLGLLTNHISVNGKGKQIEYSIASAYGELMERLQNGILIKNHKYALKNNLANNLFSKKLNEKKGALNFEYDPDEIKFESREYISKNKDFLFELFSTNNLETLQRIIIKDLGFKELICVPFYSIREKSDLFLPIELLFTVIGTNGMCAGNTPDEAIIQGLCEILERYALKEIYTKKITPPTIPKKIFVDFDVINIIRKIESTGLTLTIKDLSLDKDLPVIGVLIVDKKNHKYNFKAASHIRPEIALERCLTEFHQTSKKIRLIKINGWKDIERKENGYENILNFSKLIHNSSGHQKKDFFNTKPSYEFKSLNFKLGVSHLEDLRFLKKTVENLNTEIYVRDVSFLGFPAYYIVVPRLSRIKFLDKNDYSIYSDFNSQKENILQIKTLSKSKFKKLILSIEKWLKIDPDFWKKNLMPTFLPHLNNELSILEANLFLAMSFYKLEKFIKTEKYLTLFLETYSKEVSSFLYFYAFRDLVRLKIDKKNLDEISVILNSFYETQLVDEVIKDFKDPNNVFSFQSFPTCFKCEKCEILETCKYFEVMKMLKKIQVKQESYKSKKNVFLPKL